MRVERLCVATLVLDTAVGATAAGTQWPANRPVLLPLLALAWIVWLALLLENRRLVGCGHQGIRYVLAPRLINRPEFVVRGVFHLIINWSVVVTTLAVAFVLRSIDVGHYLAGLCLAVTGAVWLGFNVLHRRMNQGRNWLLSTAIAGSLAAVALLILR